MGYLHNSYHIEAFIRYIFAKEFFCEKNKNILSSSCSDLPGRSSNPTKFFFQPEMLSLFVHLWMPSPSNMVFLGGWRNIDQLSFSLLPPPPFFPLLCNLCISRCFTPFGATFQVFSSKNFSPQKCYQVYTMLSILVSAAAMS